MTRIGLLWSKFAPRVLACPNWQAHTQLCLFVEMQENAGDVSAPSTLLGSDSEGGLKSDLADFPGRRALSQLLLLKAGRTDRQRDGKTGRQAREMRREKGQEGILFY